MSIPPISLIAMTFSATSIIVALAMFFLVLWQSPRRRDNQLMALYMITVIFWGVSAFMTRFTALGQGDSTPYFYGIVLGIAFNSLLFFALVSNYAGLWRHWWILAALLAGFAYYIVSIPMLFNGLLYTNVAVSQAGNLSYRFEVLGYVAFIIAYLFNLGALAVLWYYRRTRAGNLLVGGIIISVGVLSSLSSVLAQFSMAVISAGVSTVFFAHAILRENLFNPLAILNEELVDANRRLSSVTEELRVANEQLTTASELKSQFLSSMSHELRTPLNSIIGYSELLMQNIYGPLNPTQSDRLEKVIRNGHLLLALINDILDLSKIEAGRMDLEVRAVELSSLIDESMVSLEPLAQKKGLRLAREIHPATPYVMADRGRALQVVMNLVSNAIKFTPAGTVTVKARRPDDLDQIEAPPEAKLQSDAWVAISVEDTGIGIAPEHQKVIFDEFRQVDGSTTRTYEGTGLGLAISRRLVHMMGGHIWVQSTVGDGSAFHILLPAAMRESGVEQASAAVSPTQP